MNIRPPIIVLAAPLLIVEYYLQWTITFEISFSGNSGTTKPRQLIVEYLVHQATTFKTSNSPTSVTHGSACRALYTYMEHYFIPYQT